MQVQKTLSSGQREAVHASQLAHNVRANAPPFASWLVMGWGGVGWLVMGWQSGYLHHLTRADLRLAASLYRAMLVCSNRALSGGR